MDHTKWSTLKIVIHDYFCLSDFKCCMQDKLARMRQKNSITGYIDAFKCCCTKIPSITGEEMLDRFMKGLISDVQRELLKQDPLTFAAACQMAEHSSPGSCNRSMPSKHQSQLKQKQTTLHK